MDYSIEEYRKAYVEVLAVIAMTPEEYRAMIPADRIEHMEAEKDPNYVFELREDVLLKHQLCKLARELVGYIYYTYMCTDAKREAIDILKAAASQA